MEQTYKYRKLIPEKIEQEVIRLKMRIEERFPDSGLAKVAQELLDVSHGAGLRMSLVAKPMIWLRLGIGVLILLIIAGVIAMIVSIGAPDQNSDFATFVQLVESSLNDIVFVGIAIFFLASLEVRVKRRKALAALDELRSIAHVIDMHQLTKDPTSLTKERVITASSPKIELDAFSLKRYLDYCSELLSLTGKLAAIFAQDLNDSVVLSAVNEVESLTTALSNKVWQKLIILHSM